MSRQESVVFVGKKPPMAYVQALMNAFTRDSTVVLKARGRSISTAVDAAEMYRRMLPGIELKDVQIDTVQLGEGSDMRNVSTIDITLTRVKA